MRPRAGRRVAARVVALARRLRQVPGEVTALQARVAALESALAGGCAPASEVARLDLAFSETSALRTAVHAREIEYLSHVSERGVEVPFVVSAYRGECRVLGPRAVATVARWLAPGGRLLLTVPFGRFEDHGWLVNYDAARLDALVAASGLRVATARYYEQRGGWVPCEPSEVARRGYGTLGVPYAGAVALLELVKSR